MILMSLHCAEGNEEKWRAICTLNIADSQILNLTFQPEQISCTWLYQSPSRSNSCQSTWECLQAVIFKCLPKWIVSYNLNFDDNGHKSCTCRIITQKIHSAAERVTTAEGSTYLIRIYAGCPSRLGTRTRSSGLASDLWSLGLWNKTNQIMQKKGCYLSLR